MMSVETEEYRLRRLSPSLVRAEILALALKHHRRKYKTIWMMRKTKTKKIHHRLDHYEASGDGISSVEFA